MERIAKFEKVSLQQYMVDEKALNDIYKIGFELFGNTKEQTDKLWAFCWEKIKLPTRSTTGSAGYDFFIPHNTVIKPGGSVRINTGIRCQIDDGWCLWLVPKSGLGSKYRVKLDNTVGICDEDYYYSDNEGHIVVCITNEGNKTLDLKAGDKFVQGVFLPYGIVKDDNASEKRNGGFGSTGK